MTWDVDISQFTAYADEMKSGKPVVNAINAGVNVMARMIQVPSWTGKTEDAFREFKYATSPEDSGGMGSMEMVGEPGTPAPRHTISEFLKWYRGGNG